MPENTIPTPGGGEAASEVMGTADAIKLIRGHMNRVDGAPAARPQPSEPRARPAPIEEAAPEEQAAEDTDELPQDETTDIPGEEPDADTDVTAEAEDAEGEEAGRGPPATIEDIAKDYQTTPAELLASTKVQVKVDGETRTVTIGEALKGYSRTEDYNQKSRALAAERTEFNTVANTAAGAWEERIQLADELANYLRKEMMPDLDNRDLERLLNEDPERYHRLQFQRENAKERLSKFDQAIRAAKSELSRERANQIQQTRRASQARLVEALPKLKDRTIAAKFNQDVHDYLVERGYPSQEARDFMDNSPFDHRQLLIIEDALYGRKVRTVQGKPQAAKADKRPQMLRPGASQSGPATREAQTSRAVANFRRAPSKESAIARIKAIRGI